MEFNVTVGLVDDGGQAYYIVNNDDDVEALYEHERDWWRNRTGKTPEFTQIIIDQQTPDYDASPPKRELGAALNAIVHDRINETGKNLLSILEIGCANGVTIRHLKKRFPDLELSYYGFEMTGILVDDFQRNFSRYDITQGGAEEFIENDDSMFPHSPYDLFLASGCLCMVKPNLVPEVLQKASRLTDRFIIWDYLENRNGQISKDRPVIFRLEDGRHSLYAHPFEKLLETIGFEIDVLEFTPPDARTHAARTGLIVASRRIDENFA